MSGARRPHNLITTNIVVELGVQLMDRPCEVYPNDMRVKVTATGLYTYPDAVVVCGEPEFEHEVEDTLLNPTLVVEVLSESTEAYDRGGNLDHYLRLPSLQEYVLVSQGRVRVERYARQAERADWLYTVVTGPDATIDLPSVGCALFLARVYHKVRLPPASASELRPR
jgi:Uma2 family endonuclease